jgi:hypothetical protein
VDGAFLHRGQQSARISSGWIWEVRSFTYAATSQGSRGVPRT